MTSTRLKIFAITALLSVAATALGDNTADQTLKQVAGYREWTRLTERPIVVAAIDPSTGTAIAIDTSSIATGG
jgi:hypothetical protein